MADPNSRRDKALEDIARELRETNKLLKQIEKNTRRVKFTNSPDAERPDPFDVPQVSQPEVTGKDDVAVMTEAEDKQFPAPTHPYLKRSLGGPDNPSGAGPYGARIQPDA